MLRDAASRKSREEKRKGPFRAAFLLVDEDRAQQADWPVHRLRSEAAGVGLKLCGQKPKFEGLLLRMFPGRERVVPVAVSVDEQLRALWPEYRKPMDARSLARKFTLDDLIRVARVEPELARVLSTIGFGCD
jgi:hypothetical protein